MLLVVLVIAALLITGCSAKETNPVSTGTEFIMDTVVTIKLYGNNAKACQEEMFLFLREKEKQLSLYYEDSEISKLNENAGEEFVTLSAYTYDLLKQAKKYCEDTGGLFDITIAPLTKLWAVTSDKPSVPEQKDIDEAKALVNYQDILLEDSTLSAKLKNKGQAVDLGGLAKGKFCDDLKKIAEQYQITSGYVSIGGNLMVIGNDNGKDFTFGIRDPLGGEEAYFATISLPNKTMATTGTYERFFEVDGVVYHHVLDPRTGYPAESDLLSVSVISEDGMLGDFLSTAIFLGGKENALKLLNQYPEVFGLVLVDKEQNVFVSDIYQDSFSMNVNSSTHYNYIK